MPECRKWYRAHKPDAILDFSERASYSLQLLGSAPNRKLGIASIDVQDEPSELAGINQNSRLVGCAAVDEVVGLILANKRGIPDIPKRVLIEGSWVNGLSAPRITGTVSSTGARARASRQ